MAVKINGVNSFSEDGIITTTYANDYSTRGNNFMFVNTASIAGETTVNFLIDLSSVPSDNTIFVETISLISSASEVSMCIYEGADYTGGTTVTGYNANRNVSDSYNFVVTTGATDSGSGKGTLIRKKSAFGSTGVAHTTAGGTAIDDKFVILNNTKKYLIELTNEGTDATKVSYSVNTFEI